jgi:hypothetical protein
MSHYDQSGCVLGIRLIQVRFKTALCSLYAHPILLLLEENVKTLSK